MNCFYDSLFTFRHRVDFVNAPRGFKHCCYYCHRLLSFASILLLPLCGSSSSSSRSSRSGYDGSVRGGSKLLRAHLESQVRSFVTPYYRKLWSLAFHSNSWYGFLKILCCGLFVCPWFLFGLLRLWLVQLGWAFIYIRGFFNEGIAEFVGARFSLG